ncbi:hypothetical protein B6U99_02125 [Candidatus Geothermarchaeota archaeon ex4572_27]|nr:MAG: hypothetical protein B6U99_02125 [Candidatus Geothermarchaeota archaeon ex4572_27]
MGEELAESQIPTIYVGKRNLSYYLNICIKMFDRGQNEIMIEGMGRNIIKAVDVANFINRLYEGGRVVIKDVKIDMVDKGVVRGLPKYVSRIRILIKREAKEGE